jgi:hypothetical protein
MKPNEDNAQQISDAEMVAIYLKGGISPVIPAAVFRKSVAPMGTTFFYDEIKKGNLRAVKAGGKTCVEIEEAVRYKRSLPKIETHAA